MPCSHRDYVSDKFLPGWLLFKINHSVKIHLCHVQSAVLCACESFVFSNYVCI